MHIDIAERAIEPGKPCERTLADAASTWLVARKRRPFQQHRAETVRGGRPRRARTRRSGAGDDNVGVHGHQPVTSARLASGAAITAESIGAAPEASAAYPAS